SDAIACALVYRISLDRTQSRDRAMLIAAAFAWCPISILLSSHHGNFDPLYAMLSLAALYIIDRHGRWFLGGLLLGAAINVKLIPVLLIPVMAAMCRSWRQLLYLAAGLALMAIPFVPVLIFAPAAFMRNVLHYHSIIDNWGVILFLREASRRPEF